MRLRKLVSMREALDSPLYFGSLLSGDSWRAWRVLLIAIVGEELTEEERVTFTSLTDREREPLELVDEFWGAIGRRGGKTRAMGVGAAYFSACIDHRDVLAPGERGVLPVMAASTAQAGQAFNYIAGVFATAPNLKDLVEGQTADVLRLTTGVDIEVRPASFRTIRGISAVAAIGDEIAFWRSDDTANPDSEILRALRPSLATTGGPLICISSPHAKRGELYTTLKRHFGPAGDPLILVAKAPSRTMNPSLPQSVVDRAFEADPESASAEYGAEFRNDVGAFVSREAVEGGVSSGIIVRPPLAGVRYLGAVDPSGGSSDSMTASVAHSEGDRIILDFIGERRPPFSPDSVVAEFSTVFKSYCVTTIYGDRYAGEWPRERFSVHGIKYEPAEMTRSEAYLSFLPLLNSGRVDLLDNARMVTQFVGLERRTSRGGRDSVDHSPGAHDDISNCVALAIVMASRGSAEPGWLSYMRWCATGEMKEPAAGLMVRLLAPIGVSHVQTYSGKEIAVPTDRVIEVSETDAGPLGAAGFTRISPAQEPAMPWP